MRSSSTIQMPTRGPPAPLPSITLLPPPPLSRKCYVNKGVHVCPASAPPELSLFHSQNNCMYLAKAVHDSPSPNQIAGICSLCGQPDSWTKEGVFHQTPCSKEFKVHVNSILPAENQSKVRYRKSFTNAITFLADNILKTDA